MSMFRRLPISLALLLLPLTARADTPGVDLPAGEYYAIEGCRMLSGGCSGTQIGAPNQGSIALEVADGETIAARIGGTTLLHIEESGGGNWQEGITSVWGQVHVYGSVSQHVARRVSAGFVWPDVIDRTILADASAGNVVVNVPRAYYHPGRRLTVKKTSTANEVHVRCDDSGTIDGEQGIVLLREWQHVTIEAAPQGSYVTGFTSDEWFVVGQ